ncbi:MAG: glycosyltransferase family 2 protein, partial [Pirellulales bacterium]|nr:glycosyltransferase family 2 protein [Pirellulales bacterium]
MNQHGTTDDLPLISCVMPTYGRPDYVNEAVKMFLDQDYPADRRELVILNDCAGQTFQCDLADQSGVRVINQPRKYPTLGQKRNACIELARGELIAVWDDDDLYLPWRLSFSLDQMQRHRTAFYRASTYWAYWGKGKLHVNQATRAWISHSLWMFRKDVWSRAGGYPNMDGGEDTRFYERVQEVLADHADRWVTYPVPHADHYYIMRGLSRYDHMSIAGGTGGLETSEGVYSIEPKPIGDPVLRDVFERLVAGRHCFTEDCIELRSELSQAEIRTAAV